MLFAVVREVCCWPEASVRRLAAIRPELGVKPTCQDGSTDAFDPLRKWSVHCSGRDYADCVRPSRKIAGRHRRFEPSFIDAQGGPLPTQRQLKI
jgi:hypothetical protein